MSSLLAGAVLLPATAWAQPNPDWIRVAVVRAEPEAALTIQGGFTIFALHTGDLIEQGRHLRAVSLRAVPDGIALGDKVLPVFGVRIEPQREATISLNGQHLRGAIEVVRRQDLTLLIVNHIGLEDYLRGVLSREAPDYWPEEALKAVAIAARTYALYQRLTKAEGDFDVTGDVLSQDYGGKSAEKRATTRAVTATEGWILVHTGKLFPTFYHSTCGGVTEHARVMGKYDLPPLQGGIRCTFCTASPFYQWRRRLTKADVGWALRKSPHGSVGTVRDLRVTKRTPSGRAERITIVGSQRTVALSGYDFRAMYGFAHIRSPLFSVIPVADAFVLDGRGWGHGVGLCQWGAAELARRGHSAAEILHYYYPHTELVRVRDLAHHPIEVFGGGP